MVHLLLQFNIVFVLFVIFLFIHLFSWFEIMIDVNISKIYLGNIKII